MNEKPHFPPPANLEGEAVTEWNRITDELHTQNMLNAIDRAALATYCSLWSTYLEADGKVKEAGIVVLTKSGNAIQNPYLSIRNTAVKMCLRAASELGLTPRSRGQAKPTDPDEEPPPGLEN